MANTYKGELQDYKGNTLYNHSEADVIFCTDGETVQEKLANYEDALGSVTGKTDSLEVNDSNILATSKATHQLAQKMGGCTLEQKGEDFFIVGADSVRKKLGSGELEILYEDSKYAKSSNSTLEYSFTAEKNGILHMHCSTGGSGYQHGLSSVCKVNGSDVHSVSTGTSADVTKNDSFSYIFKEGDVISISMTAYANGQYGGGFVDCMVAYIE